MALIQLESGDLIDPTKVEAILAREKPEGGAHVIVGMAGGFVFVIDQDSIVAAQDQANEIGGQVNDFHHDIADDEPEMSQ